MVNQMNVGLSGFHFSAIFTICRRGCRIDHRPLQGRRPVRLRDRSGAGVPLERHPVLRAGVGPGARDGAVLVIDGIALHDFEFIDVGRRLEPSHTVPVTIKSLIFK
jgi:hypothetical protein